LGKNLSYYLTKKLAVTFDYANIKGNYSLLWTTFKTSLKQVIRETDFEEPWKSRRGRTKLYFKSLLPKVASLMNLDFGEEMKFRVDGTFYVKSGQGGVKVPIVLIESENDARTSDDEVYKLCFLNAPLKVLMICNDWNEKTKLDLCEGYWDYIIESFAEENVLTGYFAIIAGEMNQNLKFYTYVYDDNGKQIEKEGGFLIEK
jgi:hypothetical protein